MINEGKKHAAPINDFKTKPTAKRKLKQFREAKGNVRYPLTDEKLLDQILDQYEDQLVKEIKSLLQKKLSPTTQSINKLLGVVKKTDIHPGFQFGDNWDLSCLLLNKAYDIGLTMDKLAYQKFKKNPDVKNYSIWLLYNYKMLDLLGIDSEIQENVKLVGDKIHIVVKGDWLSKIAKKEYGQEYLWYIIYERNGMEHHPDQLIPGQRIRLP
jgi:nucleoid-associated protein YgaU